MRPAVQTNTVHSASAVSYLLHDVYLLWAQVSVYRRDAFHTVFTHDASCKRVGNDARRRLETDQKQRTYKNISVCTKSIVSF